MEATASRAIHTRRSYTFDAWLEEWLRLCVLRGLRETTVATYRAAIGTYVSPELLSTRIRAIRPQDLNAHYERMLLCGRRDGRGGLSPRTVRFIHTIIRRSLTDAVRLGALGTNPAEAADAPSARHACAYAFRTWTPAELRRFLEAARDDEFYAAYHLAATTGLRRSELLGLRWRDLDLDRGQLQVMQAVVVVDRDVRLGPPKSRRSRRSVALDRVTVDVLKERWRAMGTGCTRSGDLVFAAPGGAPMHPVLFTYYFRKRMLASDVPPIRFHDLRHTHATHALQAGVHPKIVSERLGHATIAITLDTYSHVLPTMQREAAEAVAALIAG